MAEHAKILLATGTNEMEIVEFYIDEILPDGGMHRGSYGINVAKVVEIIRKPKATVLPLAPPGVVGTFVFRDKVIPLIDLGTQLGKRKSEEAVNPLALVTTFNKTTMAFVVAGVNRILRLPWGEIEPTDTILGNFSNSLTGLVKRDDRNILILDMEKILSELYPQFAFQEDSETPAVVTEAPYKALIVDDSRSIRNILIGNLEKSGFLVTALSNGNEAWNWLQELKAESQKEQRGIQDYLDIVISDIEMPQMDGYSLCQAIKQDVALKTLPVILFSSLIHEKQFHKGESVGADAQITKPETANLAQSAVTLITQYRSVQNPHQAPAG